MAQLIPSPPLGADPNSYVWIDWYNQVTQIIDYLNDLLLSVQTAASDAQADATAAAADAAAAQAAADDAQTAADAAQTAADAAEAAAALAQELAAAAQDTANEAIAPATYTPVGSCGAVVVGSGTATAEVRYNNNGTKDRQINGGGYTGAGNWYNPTTASIGDTHWIKFTVLSESGGTISGTTGSWLALTSARGLSLSRSTTGEAIATATVSLSTDSGGSTVVGTSTVSLSATKEA